MDGLCTLQYSLGRVEACPGARCPFWVVEGIEAGCVLTDVRSEFEGRPAVAAQLLAVRAELDCAYERREGWTLFHRLMDA